MHVPVYWKQNVLKVFASNRKFVGFLTVLLCVLRPTTCCRIFKLRSFSPVSASPWFASSCSWPLLSLSLSFSAKRSSNRKRSSRVPMRFCRRCSWSDRVRDNSANFSKNIWTEFYRANLLAGFAFKLRLNSEPLLVLADVTVVVVEQVDRFVGNCRFSDANFLLFSIFNLRWTTSVNWQCKKK